MATVLITGGSGLVGNQLSKLLLEKGYQVKLLSRNRNLDAKFKTYKWDIVSGEIDDEAILNTDYIIHLAGANISNGKWTRKRKKILVDSRVKSGQLLLKKVKELNPDLKAFVAASATGYYGSSTSEIIFSEEHLSTEDFLGSVCKRWEETSFLFQEENIRTVVLRTGIVLTPNGGALKKLIAPVKLGVASPIGSGNQYMLWIHIDDLCEMYVHALQKEEINGAYNAVTSDHITNKEFTKTLAKVMKRPFWPFNVPSFILKLVFGEMVEIILEGSRVSNKKVLKTGFKFKNDMVDLSLRRLLNKPS